MKQLFSAAVAALRQGEPFVLCSVIRSSGSTPRSSGAKMAVFPDGAVRGTVGGGVSEYRTILAAKEVLADHRPQTLELRLSHSEQADIGMICGGRLTVYLQYVSPDCTASRSALEAAAESLGTAADTWLLTDLTTGELGFYRRSAGRIEPQPPQDALPLLRPTAQCGERYYAEPLSHAGSVYVFGGGHVSAETVPLLASLDFRVVLFEERPDFCTAERFPDAAERILGSYANISEHVRLTKDDYVVILTRGHQGDFDALLHAMRTDVTYIGVIGSRHKVAEVNERLVQSGIDRADLGRIHSPIGLSIGAVTPMEIAVSIAGELIAHRAALR